MSIIMKNKILKRIKVNAFEVKSADCTISRDDTLDCGKHINEFLLKPKSYKGILHIERIMNSIVVYAYGSMKDCWDLVKQKFLDNVIPLGEVPAEILYVGGKNTKRHIFVADCSGSMLKG